MKFNLKTFPACENPVDCMVLDWLRGFEAELRGKLTEIVENRREPSEIQLLTEILGE